jgi:hypothetical protein
MSVVFLIGDHHFVTSHIPTAPIARVEAAAKATIANLDSEIQKFSAAGEIE